MKKQEILRRNAHVRANIGHLKIAWEEFEPNFQSTTSFISNPVTNHDPEPPHFGTTTSGMSQASGSENQESPTYTISFKDSISDSKVKVIRSSPQQIWPSVTSNHI
jgi:hypothetical protein